jgi:hypothetical protein
MVRRVARIWSYPPVSHNYPSGRVILTPTTPTRRHKLVFRKCHRRNLTISPSIPFRSPNPASCRLPLHILSLHLPNRPIQASQRSSHHNATETDVHHATRANDGVTERVVATNGPDIDPAIYLQRTEHRQAVPLITPDCDLNQYRLMWFLSARVNGHHLDIMSLVTK